MAMYAMATSKAIGTGRNAPTRATRTMPPSVTCAMRAGGGRSSMTRAPRTAASIINGKATRKTYQKLLRKDRAVETNAWRQVSKTSIPMEQARAEAEPGWREATAGAKTKMRKRTVASLSSATEAGKSAKVMERTTTLSAGEAKLAASTDSVLMPEA